MPAAATPLKLLITTPHFLWPNSAGAARRTLGIAHALAGQGHNVELLTPDRQAPTPAFAGLTHQSYRGLGPVGHFFNPFFRRALHSALRRKPELVIAEFPYQAPALTTLSARFNIPMVYDAHNCEADRFSQVRGKVLGALVAQREARIAELSQGILCVSESDRAMIRSRYGRASLLLPNGVDTGVFTPAPADARLLAELGLQGKRVALYFGSFDYLPNRNALSRLLTLDWPQRQQGLPDTHLLVVGRQSRELTPQRNGVLATGEVADITAYIRLANIVLAPLEEGGGTRLKIIEALACGQTVLSTRFGAMGLEGSKVDGLHCCDWGDFEQSLRTLLRNPMPPGQNTEGRKWAESMDWRRLTENIDWEEGFRQPDQT
jgi:glycosyltransferase involved in cell wall biosynthesis